MPNIEKSLREEITRICRGVMSRELAALRRDNAAQRKDIDELKRRLAIEERQSRAYAHALHIERSARVQATPLHHPETSNKGQHRFSAKGLKTLRQHLDLSPRQFGILLDVSRVTIYNWEQGRSRPPKRSLRAIDALRGTSKREAQDRLAARVASGHH